MNRITVVHTTMENVIIDDIRAEVIITERAIIEADKVDRIRQDS